MYFGRFRFEAPVFHHQHPCPVYVARVLATTVDTMQYSPSNVSPELLLLDGAPEITNATTVRRHSLVSETTRLASTRPTAERSNRCGNQKGTGGRSLPRLRGVVVVVVGHGGGRENLRRWAVRKTRLRRRTHSTAAGAASCRGYRSDGWTSTTSTRSARFCPFVTIVSACSIRCAVRHSIVVLSFS